MDDSLPTFLLDRLPDSKTLSEILARAGWEVATDKGYYSCTTIPDATGAYWTFTLPAQVTPLTEYVLYDLTIDAEQQGLLRIIRPDANGWYSVTQALPEDGVRVDMYGWHCSYVTEQLERAVDVSTFMRWARTDKEHRSEGIWNSSWLKEVTHWRYVKPPVEIDK